MPIIAHTRTLTATQPPGGSDGAPGDDDDGPVGLAHQLLRDAAERGANAPEPARSDDDLARVMQLRLTDERLGRRAVDQLGLDRRAVGLGAGTVASTSFPMRW